MQKFVLSDRMAAVASLVPPGVSACDVGCDHGFVSIYLVREKICPRVIAMDVNRGPLLRAREHIESAGMSAYIETRLSDGIEKLLPGEAECMIAAGMGGRLIVKILEAHPETLGSLRYLVLQPQSELRVVREYLRGKGFLIRKEDMVLEDGKFYPMMLAEMACPEEAGKTVCACGDRDNGCNGKKEKKDGRESSDDEARRMAYRESLEDEFGPCLIREAHPVLLKYLAFWEGQQEKIRKEVLPYPERLAQVEEELARIRDVREMMQNKITAELG